LQNKIKVNKIQINIFSFLFIFKVDPGAIVFTRGFSLEHTTYGG
jgi:hypothetical protein